jgi:hypothetical protein
MTRIERTPLPDGLQATAYRDKKDGLVVYVSSTLDAKSQRAAVMVAIRAARRTEWWTGLLPPAGVAVLVALRAWLWRGVTVLKAQPVAWAAGTTATVTVAAAAGAFYTTGPPHHRPPQSAPAPAHSTGPSPYQSRGQHQASGHQPGRSGKPGQTQPGQGRPGSASKPGPGRESLHGQSAPLPTPAPSGSNPGGGGPAPPASPPPLPTLTPTPTPSPSPSPTQKPGTCVYLLGVKVCLPL